MKQIKLDENLLNKIDTEKNPRYNNKTKYIFEEMDISKLMESISSGWRIDSQIYIRKYEDKDKYYVVEGNRRISSLKKYYDHNYELASKEEIDTSVLKLLSKAELLEMFNDIQIYEVESQEEENDIIERYHYSDDLKKGHDTLNNRFHMERKYFLDKDRNPYNQSDYNDLALFYYFSEIPDLKQEDYKKYVKKPTPIPRTLFQNSVKGEENNIKEIFSITNKEDDNKLEFNIGKYQEEFKDLFKILLVQYTDDNWINNNKTSIDDFYDKLTPKLKEIIYGNTYKTRYKSSNQKIKEGITNYKQNKNNLKEVLDILGTNIRNNNESDDNLKEKKKNDTALYLILIEYEKFYNNYKTLINNPISAHIICRSCMENFWFNYYINDNIVLDFLIMKDEEIHEPMRTNNKNVNIKDRLPKNANPLRKKIKENKEEVGCLIDDFPLNMESIIEIINEKDIANLSIFSHFPHNEVDIVNKIPNIVNLHLELYLFFNSTNYQTSLISV